MAAKVIAFGSHYQPGRHLCSGCQTRYTALEACPDCVRRAWQAEPPKVVRRAAERRTGG